MVRRGANSVLRGAKKRADYCGETEITNLEF